MSNQTLKILGDYALDDKADVVLMVPVESLLDMVPFQVSMPYSGLQTKRLPGKDSVTPGGKGDQGVFTEIVYLVTVRGPLLHSGRGAL